MILLYRMLTKPRALARLNGSYCAWSARLSTAPSYLHNRGRPVFRAFIGLPPFNSMWTPGQCRVSSHDDKLQSNYLASKPFPLSSVVTEIMDQPPRSWVLLIVGESLVTSTVLKTFNVLCPQLHRKFHVRVIYKIWNVPTFQQQLKLQLSSYKLGVETLITNLFCTI